MKVKILGAHNVETKTTHCTNLLVDDVLALDAGALSSTLSSRRQLKLKALLLTHLHYDHLKDVPMLAMNFLMHRKTLNIYTTRSVFNVVMTHLMNDVLYPNFTLAANGPSVKFII